MATQFAISDSISPEFHIPEWLMERPRSVFRQEISSDRFIVFLAFVKDRIEGLRVQQGLSKILGDIDALWENENENDYIFRPTIHSYNSARAIITRAYRALEVGIQERLDTPKVFSDGTGGIVIQWRNNGKKLNAGFRPKIVSRLYDYIYHESGDVYDMVPLSPTRLTEWLQWLVHE